MKADEARLIAKAYQTASFHAHKNDILASVKIYAEAGRFTMPWDKEILPIVRVHFEKDLGYVIRERKDKSLTISWK